ncbi:MAG: GntP family permease [Micrococcaceae bacterium]
MSDNTLWIVSAAILAVVFLLTTIIRFKFQPFVALLLAAIVFGLITGTAPLELVDEIVDAMGGALGQVSLVIGLGAIFGEVLQRAGAADQLARTLTEKVSPKVLPWALGMAGFLVSIAVFIDVAIVILFPLLYAIARKTGKSLLYYAIPLGAGISVTHTFIPPTPGPIATASILGADLGLVILFGTVCGLPAMAVAGPLFSKWIGKKMFVPVPLEMARAEKANDSTGGSMQGPFEDENPQEGSQVQPLPSFISVFLTLLLPLVLILLGTTGGVLLSEDTAAGQVVGFLGNPVVALLITVLFTLWYFGVRRGIPGTELQSLASAALAPAGLIILITGAGAVFGSLLVDSGMGEILAGGMQAINMPVVLFGFLAAAVIRISQGSGTVAMITGATLTAPILQVMEVGPALSALTVIAIASGGTAFSHVNDSGFWMANRYLGMSVSDTLKSWTVMKTLVGLTGLAMTLVIYPFVV